MAQHSEKLKALREKFAEADGGTIFTPAYQRVADKIFSDDGRRPAPYAGMPTLLDAPHRSLEALQALQVGLFGVPMDLGVTNRNGSRFGPRALRSIERVGPYNDALQTAPVQEMAVADIGDVPFQSRFDLAQSHKDIEDFAKQLVSANVLPMAVSTLGFLAKQQSPFTPLQCAVKRIKRGIQNDKCAKFALHCRRQIAFNSDNAMACSNCVCPSTSRLVRIRLGPEGLAQSIKTSPKLKSTKGPWILLVLLSAA